MQLTKEKPLQKVNHGLSSPFHTVSGLANFRDIGGWPISSPTSPSTSLKLHFRRNLIYRGGDTTRVTHKGQAQLRAFGIKRDYDLRSRQQIETAGGIKEMDGIERVWTPVFGEEDYTEERARERYEQYAGEGTQGIVQAFIEILMAGGPMFHTVLSGLLGSEQAVFLHCTTGNNRTGVFVAILLLLLHVPHCAIIHEYTLSNTGLGPTRHINIERLLAKGAFAEYGPEEARRKCERMVSARAESMVALIEEVTRRWGPDGERYFREVVGLSGDEITRMRKLLTAEGEGYSEIGA